MIDAVLFDLGNVLAFHDNEKLFRELAQTFRTTPAEMTKRLDGSGVWARANTGHLRGDALRQELSARFHHAPTREQFERAWSSHFSLNVPMVRLVESLVGRVKLVLLSNTHDLHVAHLRPQLPVLARFDALILSCEVGHMKPQPEIYRLALEAAGTAAERAVFFDDVQAYVDAAKAVGLHAHVFRSASDVPAQLAALGIDTNGAQ
jgi:HAD superfamily hydrolase (TIGR01509 family)